MRPFLAVLAFLGLAVPFAMPVLSVPGPGSVVPGDGCGPVTREQLLQNEAFWSTYFHYEEEAGFVDLLVEGETSFRLVALFDLDRRGALPLPDATDPVHGYPVEVRGERFVPLQGLPTVPQACSLRISPGVGIGIGNAGCSANFIFRDQLDRLYFGTAGHCGLTGARVSVSGLGPSGTIVYRISQGVGSDFALVAVDLDKYSKVNPAMCRWGGPTTETQGGPGLVYHYGNPVVYGQHHFTEARVGYSPSGGGVNSFSFSGAVASGDSGSGAEMATGNALGVVTHTNLGTPIGIAHSAPSAFGTTVGRAMALAEAATGLDLELVTAPLA